MINCTWRQIDERERERTAKVTAFFTAALCLVSLLNKKVCILDVTLEYELQWQLFSYAMHYDLQKLGNSTELNKEFN